MAEYRGVNGVARKVTKVYRGVNGVARKIKTQYRGVSGVARKFFGGEPWEEAAALVGYSVVSLDALLKNSAACNAMANNSTAYGIMKSNYSSQLKSYIDSNWNEGLNTLNYKCGLKTYLFNSGNVCTGVTGGWNGTVTDSDFGGTERKASITSTQIYLTYNYDNSKGISYRRTTNNINRSGYSKVGLVSTCYCHPHYSYDSSTAVNGYDDIVGTGNANPTSFPTFNSGNTPITVYCGNTSSTNNRQSYWYITKMWLE